MNFKISTVDAADAPKPENPRKPKETITPTTPTSQPLPGKPLPGGRTGKPLGDDKKETFLLEVSSGVDCWLGKTTTS